MDKFTSSIKSTEEDNAKDVVRDSDENFDVSDVDVSSVHLKKIEGTEPLEEENEVAQYKTVSDREKNAESTEQMDFVTAVDETKSMQKENIFLRIVKRIIPLKGDNPSELIRKIVFLFSFAVLVVCCCFIGNEFADTTREVEIKNQLIEMRGEMSIEENEYQEIKEKVPGILDEYIDLYKRNSDIVGWVKIDGTAVDYPIVQQKDTNKFYLSHNFDKEESRSGCIVADFRSPFTPTFRPANTILYGHNMASGEFFASITNYKPYNDRLDYYSEHPTIDMDTIYEKGKYKIFAAMLTNVDEEDGKVFYYCLTQNFKTKNAFNNYVGNVLDRSMFYNPDVDITYGDEIITLSTCDFSMGDSADLRFVVFARRVRDGESPEVDVSKAYINDDPLYFDFYYDIMGGEWGGRKWGSELLKSYTPTSDKKTQKTAGVESNAE